MADRLEQLRRRLEMAAHKHWMYALEDLGGLGGLPFYRVRIPTRGRELYRIVLAAGIHGDEPAGVEAMLRMLETHRIPANLALECYPCMNPEGYARDTREDAHGRDLNRHFCLQEAPPWPVQRFMQALSWERCDLYVDLHEDSGTTGFYAFELTSTEPSLARPIAEQLASQGFPLESAPALSALLEADGLDFAGCTAETGVVRNRIETLPQEAVPQGIFMAHRADHTMTFETPSRLPFEQRVAMHVSALDALFAQLKGRRQALLPNEFQAAEARRPRR